MDWLDDRWDRLQPPRDPTDGLSGYRKWMDEKKKITQAGAPQAFFFIYHDWLNIRDVWHVMQWQVLRYVSPPLV